MKNYRFCSRPVGTHQLVKATVIASYYATTKAGVKAFLNAVKPPWILVLAIMLVYDWLKEGINISLIAYNPDDSPDRNHK